MNNVKESNVVIDIKALGIKVKYYREKLDLNIPELAAKAGTDKTQLSRLEKGLKPDITLGTINKIAAALEISTSELLSESDLQELSKPETDFDKLLGLKKALGKLGTKELEYIGDVLQLPVRGYVRAGTPCVTEQEEGEYMIIARSVVESLTNHPNEIYVLKIEGESIAGDGAHTGDYLLIKPTHTMDINGDLYIIRDPDTGESVVRHLIKTDHQFRIESSNPDYKPLLLDKVEIVGRVIYIQPQGRKPIKK